jgi:drug/metabolite transporter (DMT)-like permease
MKPLHLVALVLFNLVWGATFVVYKSLPASLDYETIVTLRFGIAAIGAMLVWPWLPGPAPRGAPLARTLALGVVVFVIGHRLQVLGNALGTAGNSAVLMAFEPVMTSVAAALFLREHVPARRWLAFALSVGGVLLLNGIGRPDFQWMGLAASALILASFLGETAYSVVGKPIIQRADPVKTLALALLAGLVVNVALCGDKVATAARTLPLNAWLLLGFMGIIATLAGYAAWFFVLRDTDVNLVALTVFIQPLAGVPLAVWLLGEPLHAGHLWGSAAIATGLLIGLQFRPAPMPPPASVVAAEGEPTAARDQGGSS